MAKSICVSNTSASLRPCGGVGVCKPSQSQETSRNFWPYGRFFRRPHTDGIFVKDTRLAVRKFLSFWRESPRLWQSLARNRLWAAEIRKTPRADALGVVR